MSQKIYEIAKDYQTIIWDWNGTLLDDIAIIGDAEAEHFTAYGITPPTAEEREKLFCFPIKKYYENLGFDFNKLNFETVNAEFLVIYERLMMNAPLFKGIPELLAQLNSMNKRQFVLSAAPHDHLQEILAHKNILGEFEKAYGLPHKLADSKVERGRELISNHDVDASNTLMIGDTDHDFEVAQALGFDALLIADGHHSFERLKETHHQVLESRF